MSSAAGGRGLCRRPDPPSGLFRGLARSHNDYTGFTCGSGHAREAANTQTRARHKGRPLPCETLHENADQRLLCIGHCRRLHCHHDLLRRPVGDHFPRRRSGRPVAPAVVVLGLGRVHGQCRTRCAAQPALPRAGSDRLVDPGVGAVGHRLAATGPGAGRGRLPGGQPGPAADRHQRGLRPHHRAPAGFYRCRYAGRDPVQFWHRGVPRLAGAT